MLGFGRFGESIRASMNGGKLNEWFAISACMACFKSIWFRWRPDDARPSEMLGATRPEEGLRGEDVDMVVEGEECHVTTLECYGSQRTTFSFVIDYISVCSGLLAYTASIPQWVQKTPYRRPHRWVPTEALCRPISLISVKGSRPNRARSM